MATEQVEYDQPTSVPVPKVKAVAIAGVVITAIVAVLTAFGIIVPSDVSDAAQNGVAAVIIIVSAVQTVITFAAGYFKRDVKPVVEPTSQDLRG